MLGRIHYPVVALFVLVLLANSLYLTRVPSLIGDEGSEGQNVYELLHHKGITLTGERSYISPLMDYVRVPFVWLFGYTALAIRLPMLIVTIISFWLAIRVFTRLWGETAALYACAFLFLSPVYILYQRLGWAITLFPFWALLLFELLTQPRRPSTPLLVGFVAGLALANHIIFLATATAIASIAILRGLRYPKQLLTWWPSLIGFWAGFGMQFVILFFQRDDQGDPLTVASSFTTRLEALPHVLLNAVSGSSFIAQYTGVPLGMTVQLVMVSMLSLLILAALIFTKPRLYTWLWFVGTILQLTVLLVIIDRFTLRYLVVPALALWVLAGIGAAALAGFAFRRWPRATLVVPSVIAVGLLLFIALRVFLPYQQTGGSTENFYIGQRPESAASMVNSEPLLKCITDIGPVATDSIHIYNRLEYLGHSNPHIKLVTDSKQARFAIAYRMPNQEVGPYEKCPELTHFRVVERR